MNVIRRKIQLRDEQGFLRKVILVLKTCEIVFDTRARALIANRTFQKFQTFDRRLIEGVPYEEVKRR